VLADDVVAEVDVPGFDRSNVDGFAVQAGDTFGAMEEAPRTVALNDEVLAPGIVPSKVVVSGVATPIATGGMLPRAQDAGADGRAFGARCVCARQGARGAAVR
jgi:putative molybdopterin biosynthesis protein